MRKPAFGVRPMMKRIAGLALVSAMLFSANAQDAGQINSVATGHSCPGCNLFQANLSYHDLPGLDLSGSRLRQSDLSLTTMNGVNFEASDLSVSNLFGARFTGANFLDANLSRSILVGAHFGGANLSGANLAQANLSGAELDAARGLTQAQLNTACGDPYTRLPEGLTVPMCAAPAY